MLGGRKSLSNVTAAVIYKAVSDLNLILKIAIQNLVPPLPSY